MNISVGAWVSPYGLDQLQRGQAEHGATPLPGWGHKTDVRVGDTVYLRHKDTVRVLTLATSWNADPVNSKVSVTSPIGQAVIGRQQGDTVRLHTLDGYLKYEIIKII